MSTFRPIAVLLAAALIVSCRSEVEVPYKPPEVRKDYAKTAVDTPVNLDLLANDFDPNGEALDVVEIGAASHGVAVLNPDDTVTYTPDTGYAGGDSFAVWVRDASGNKVRGDAYVSVGDSLRLYYKSNYVDYFADQLYMADVNLPGVAIPISGRIPVTVGPDRPGTNVNSYLPNDPGSTVLPYVADDSASSSKFNVFVADLTKPGTATKVTNIGEGFGLLVSAGPPQLSADGAYVYYYSTEFNPDVGEIVRIEVANPANKVRMNPAIASEARIARFLLTPDKEHLLYYFTPAPDAPDPTVAGLYVIDVDVPGVSTKISGTPTTDTSGASAFGGLAFLPGGSELLYVGTENGSNTLDIYRVDYLTPAAPVLISGSALQGGVEKFDVTSDGSRVLYLSREDNVQVLDLYMVSLASPGVSTRLSKVRTDESAVADFTISFDDTFVVYSRDDDVDLQREIFRVDFANPTVQIKINHALAATEDVFYFRLSEGAPRDVLYATNPSEPRIVQLKRVSVDTPGVATDVFELFDIRESSCEWTPDAQHLICSGPFVKDNTVSLFLYDLLAPANGLVKLTPEHTAGDQAGTWTYVP